MTFITAILSIFCATLAHSTDARAANASPSCRQSLRERLSGQEKSCRAIAAAVCKQNAATAGDENGPRFVGFDALVEPLAFLSFESTTFISFRSFSFIPAREFLLYSGLSPPISLIS